MNTGLWILLLTICATSALADDYHYKNLMIGERASGLGGAYTAISDDPSGIYHNPAGIVFSQENYFSLSANAFNTTTETYANVAGGQNYVYKSQSLVPLFFGMTQTVGKSKYGFAVVVPNSDLNDQEDSLANLGTTTDRPNSFRRRFFKQDMTYLFGPAFGTELTQQLTIGFTIFGVYKSMKAIDHQLILMNPANTGKYLEQYTTVTRSTYALLPKLGLQYMPTPKLSFGVTAAMPYTLSGSAGFSSLGTKTANGSIVTPNGSFVNDKTLADGTDESYKLPKALQLSLGSAYFLSKTTLFSGQVDYYGSAMSPTYNPQSTINFSLGSEVFVSELFALRAGLFTNNANTPAIVSGAMNQLTHVNQLGGTFALAFCKPGSSLTLGMAYASGQGQGQALGDTTALQDVTLKTLGIYLMGSYQL